MSIDGVSGRTSYIGTGILNLRSQLDTLTEQLASGKIANTYAGQGSGRSLAVSLRAQISGYASYSDTATNVNTRLDVMNLSLTRLTKINSEVKGAAVAAGNTLDNNGQTAGQKTASLDFFDSVDMLNARSGDRYLFSGRATDTPPVTSADQILNGNGAGIAGLKTVIAERLAADLGTIVPDPTPPAVTPVAQIGRISSAVGASTTSVVLTEQDTIPPNTASNPFGIKLTAIAASTSLITGGATVTAPVPLPSAAAVQQTMSVDLGASVPKNGDTIKFTFKMPDGSSEDIVMTAKDTTPLGVNEFLIGANNSATATSLNKELTASIKTLANGPMAAASAIQAGNEFFGQPPQRVSGALATATSLVNGSSSDTVIWYNGEKDSAIDPARGTAVARVDQSITVQYGARADEQALRTQFQTVAVFAAVTTSAGDPYASAKIAALNQRVAQNLAIIPGTQTIQDIQADVAGAQASIKATTDRQAQAETISQTMLDSIEGINNDEVATKILALQTSLQASYQTTSKLYQMSLVNFL
jgi:flagellin-like hook-associated protein FlgL